MKPSVLCSGLLLITTLACLGPRLKADFEAELKGWVGRPIAEFIQAKGNPSEVRPRPGGGKVYVFLTHRSQGLPRDTAKFANPDGTLGDAAMTMGGPLSCRLTVESDASGTILTAKGEGNDCW